MFIDHLIDLSTYSFIYHLFIYQPIHSFTSDDVTYVYDDVTDDY